MNQNLQDRLVGSLVGLAVGDAVGTTVEFRPRGSFPTVTDMTGGGPFRLPVGAWTDDTSMALCLAESLIANQQLDKKDLLNRFCNWYKYGNNSSTGHCFDIGNTTASALEEFLHSGATTNNPEDFYAGNGSIMRLSPAAIANYNNIDQAVRVAKTQSETTHANIKAVCSSELLAEMLVRAFTATNKQQVVDIECRLHWPDSVCDIVASGVVRKQEHEIQSTGYVIHTLEAAVWAFLNTDSFEAAVLKAVNLGGDADTIGAVVGQIAGAYYGEYSIPTQWLTKLHDYKRIRQIAINLTN
jgi:ADP-ribosyl-[dinitrogen reductase] hydrolase